MRYEVVEDSDVWVVCSEGRELARYGDQDRALQDVAERLRSADTDTPSSVSVRYSRKSA